jgi:membrane protease YdiL (CAAX protease family)
MQYRAGEDWAFFFYHQLTYGFYFFFWEWFYRGFLTFGLARGLGSPAAIVLQSVGFGIMHIGKPMPEVYGSFAAGIALGWLATKGRSFYPCFLLHWAVSVTFDILAVYARPGGIF